MENASKALIMAGSILLGIMIISIAMFLFRNMGEYSKSQQDEIATVNIAEFNNKFLKYENQTVTAQDVVTLINLAQDNNNYHELPGPENNSVYISVLVSGTIGGSVKETSDTERLNDFIKNNDEVKFKCAVEINDLNGRVKKVTITKQ